MSASRAVTMRIDACPSCGELLEVRSGRQNNKLHALCGDLSASMQWAGQWLDTEQWKRLLTAAYCRAKKENAILIPALDGAGFDVLYRRTSRMSKKEMDELISYAEWWRAEHESR